jgi:hypothetical protein
MPKDQTQIIDEKLTTIIELLQNLLALELARNGATHSQICKRIHVTNKKVGEMLKGAKE